MTSRYPAFVALLILLLSPTLTPSVSAAPTGATPAAVRRPITELSPILADAVTRQPLAGVIVREMSNDLRRVLQAPLSDEKGRVMLSGNWPEKAQLLLHLSHPAYQPAEVRRTLAQLSTDTLFLTPLLRELPGVTVRASEIKTTVLSTITGKQRGVTSYYLLPAVSMAAYLPSPQGADATASIGGAPTPATISQVRVRFKPLPIREGGMRLRLLACPTADNSIAPQGADLIAPIELTTPLLAQALASAEKGELIVDLTFANLSMPANGVFVVLEALATKAGDKFISVSSNGKTGLVITGTDEKDPSTYSTSKLDEYPRILSAESTDPSRTWIMGSDNKGWRLRKTSEKGRSRQILVSLVLSS